MVSAWARSEQVGEGVYLTQGASELQKKGSSWAVVWAAVTQQREKMGEGENLK